jgi:glutathione S-transferase
MGYKLYAWTNQHFFLYTCQIAAKMAGVECAYEQKPYGKSEDKDWNAKKAHHSYPILELEDGKMLSQTNAVCSYLLKVGGKADMLGSNAFEQATVNCWTTYVTTTVDA